MALTHGAFNAPASETVMSSFELIDPNISNELHRPYGTEGIEMYKLRSQGAESMVSGTNWSHFEKDKSHTSFKLQAKANSGPGWTTNDSVTYLLHADSIDASGRFYPRKGDVVTFKGGIQGKITAVTNGAVNTAAITVRPTIDTVTLPAVGAAEVVVITGSLFASGTGAPVGAISSYSKYSHQAQIMKEAVSANGTSMVIKSYITLYNAAGEAQGLYSEQFRDGEMRLMKKMETTLMIGKQNSTSTANDGDVTFEGHTGQELTTTSLFEAAETRGFTDTYGSWSAPLTDFDGIAANYVKNYVPQGTVIWCSSGLQARNDLSNALASSTFNVNDDQYVDKVNNAFGISQDAGINFQSFGKSGLVFAFDTNMVFSDEETLGAEGYTFDETMITIPIGKYPAVIGEKRQIPNFGIRYVGQGDYKRRFIVDSLAGVGATHGGNPAVHEYDYARHIWLTHFGAEFFNAINIGKITKS